MSDIETIYTRLLSQGYALRLFGDLQKIKHTGRNNYEAICPFHDDHSQSFSFATDKPLWNCWSKCGGGDWIKYLEKREGLTFQEALQKLSREAGIELEEYDKENWEKENERANILENGLEFCQKELWTAKGKKPLEYLKSRGYTEDEIKEIGLGCYPGKKALADYFASRGYSLGTVNTVYKWLELRDDYKLVIPYRDPLGRLKSLWGRLIRPLKAGEKEADKYKPFTEAEGTKDTPFNMDKARGNTALIVVEGYFDALTLTAKGIKNVIATGQAQMTEKQLASCLRYGVKNFVLCFDNDETGRNGTEKTLRLIKRAEKRTYVVTLQKMYHDPDEFVMANGINAFKQIEPMPGVKWIAHRILAKHDVHSDKGRRDTFDEAITYEEFIADPIDNKDFIDTIAEGLGISREMLEPKIKDYQEKKARQRLQESYREFLTESNRLLESGKLNELREHIDESLKDLRGKTVTKIITPYTLKNLQADILQTAPRLKTGYPSLDKLITIPPGTITIIAGRPSHGKTTLLMNIFLNMVSRYPQRVFLFFSYEESKRKIGVKLINILSGTIIDEARNLEKLQSYLGAGYNTNVKIEQGKAQYKDFTEGGQLWVIDYPYYVNELCDTIAYMNDRYSIGAVFIDYIQKIKNNGRYQTRQLELQKTSEALLETAKSLNVPVIIGAQLGRDKDNQKKVHLDNLHESGGIDQDANLVIGLHNPKLEKAQDEGEILRDRVVELSLWILKNRDGVFNEKITLTLDRPTLIISDPETPDSR